MQNSQRAAHIIIFGNNVSGAGKTLTAAACAIALRRAGTRIATIDCAPDGEGSLTAFWRRRAYNAALPQPAHATATDETTLAAKIAALSADHAVIIVDTPRGETPVARHALAFADTLVTPLRPADLASLAAFKNNTDRFESAAPYAELIEQQALRRIERTGMPPCWFALRARTLHAPLSKARQTPDAFDKLSSHLGFLPLTALHERPLYNDLFAQGLTVHDLPGELDLPAVAARQEVRSLLHALLPAAPSRKRA